MLSVKTKDIVGIGLVSVVSRLSRWKKTPLPLLHSEPEKVPCFMIRYYHFKSWPSCGYHWDELMDTGFVVLDGVVVSPCVSRTLYLNARMDMVTVGWCRRNLILIGCMHPSIVTPPQPLRKVVTRSETSVPNVGPRLDRYHQDPNTVEEHDVTDFVSVRMFGSCLLDGS